MSHTDTLLTADPSGVTQVTMVERIANEIHRTTDEDKDNIKIAIINAIDFHKHDRFWFNEASATITLEDGTDEYGPETSEGELDGLPTDFLRPDKLFIQISDVWRELVQRSIDQLRLYKSSDNWTGWPKYFAWHHERLIVSPIPNDDYSLRIDYVKDLGVPRYKYVDGWVFTEPDSEAPWGSSFSNAWLDDAEMMIRQYAKWLLFSDVYDKDPEQANRAWSNYLLAKSQLRKAHTNYHQRIQRTPKN